MGPAAKVGVLGSTFGRPSRHADPCAGSEQGGTVWRGRGGRGATGDAVKQQARVSAAEVEQVSEEPAATAWLATPAPALAIGPVVPIAAIIARVSARVGLSGSVVGAFGVDDALEFAAIKE